MPWDLPGNAGTNPSTDFLGTTDNQPLVIKTNAFEIMRITSAGNIGVGTGTPRSNLHVNVPASGNPINAFSLDVQSFLTPQNASNSYFLQIRDIDAAPPNGFTHFCIRGDGNVGIGTATPGASLEVAGTGAKFSGIIGPLNTETHTDANVYVGVLASTPRIIFGGSTTTHEIDNDGSLMRFFRPGLVDMVIEDVS